MNKVTSKDGTTIAFDKTGSGPAVILVGGATMTRPAWTDLARLLSPHFMVYAYDRRGRGDSTNTLPFAVEREIEDIDAMITDAGGTASLYGGSSGACLALHAAAQLPGKVQHLALYEAPYSTLPGAKEQWHKYRQGLASSISEGRNSDAVELFLGLVGVPQSMISGMKDSPTWASLVAVTPTLEYDAAAMGPDREPPLGLAAKVDVPTLVMDGEASLTPMPFMRESAEALAKTMPNAVHKVIPGQAHDIDPKALAPVLIDFFGN